MVARRIRVGTPAAATTTWDSGETGNGCTLSGGNLIATCPSGNGFVYGTTARNSGKLYFEFTLGGGGNWTTSWYVFLRDTSHGSFPTGYVIARQNVWAPDNSPGAVANNTPVSGDVMGVAIDFTHHTAWTITTTNAPTWNGDVGASPTTNTGGADFSASVSSGSFQFGFNQFDAAGTPTVTLNTGGSAFSLGPPSGFSAWG